MKHYIKIENLNSDPYSMIFLDGKDYEYCESAAEVAIILTDLITNFQNNKEDFYLECVDVNYFDLGEYNENELDDTIVDNL